MPRPENIREIDNSPPVTWFKPAGIPMRKLEEVVLTLDEIEAIRLADAEGLYHEQVAEQMKVSRPTVGRILASARSKVADALVNGKAMRIEGGTVVIRSKSGRPCHGRGRRGQQPGDGGGSCKNCICPDCGEVVAHQKGMPCNQTPCPKCGAFMMRK